MKSSALIADHWGTPTLLATGSPYFPWYFLHIVAPRWPCLTSLIISSGNPFLQSVAHIFVLLIFPNALGRSVNSIRDHFSLSCIVRFLYRIYGGMSCL